MNSGINNTNKNKIENVFIKSTFKNHFKDKTNIILLAIIILATVYAIAVRFKNIGILAYWGDDGQTFLGTMGILKYGYPILPSGNVFYHTIFHFYLRVIPSLIFGLNEVGLRFPSAFFGILMVPLIFVFVKDLLNKYAGTMAAIITALNIWQIELSREVRYYSEFQFFYILSVYLFYRGYFKGDKKFKIPALVFIFLTTIIHGLGFTLIFLFIPLLIYKKFKGFFKKDIIIALFIVIALIAGQITCRELFWKVGSGFYQTNITSNITNPLLRTLSEYFTAYTPYYHRIFSVLFPQMYYLIFFGIILIVLYLFIPRIRGNEEDFINIYSNSKYSIKLPFNLFFLYFIFYSNTVFNGFVYMTNEQRYIYQVHPIFIAIYCYIIFDIGRLGSLAIFRLSGKDTVTDKYLFYLKKSVYLITAAIIFFLTVNWINPVSNLKIINRKNGEAVNSNFAVSNTFSFHPDPKIPGQYIFNNKKDGDIVIAIDLLNSFGYTKQIDYWLWTGGFSNRQPYMFKDSTTVDEFFGVPVVKDIYQFYKILNDNAGKNIWLITSNSIGMPSYISPDVAQFINSQEQYKKIVGKDGVCTAYLFPKTDKGTRGFFFIPADENIINVKETLNSQPFVIGFANNKNQKYFKYGWSKIESSGTWSDKTSSILFLNFSSKKDYKITVKAMPLFTPEQKQEMKVLFNGKEIGNVKFESPEFGEFSFNIEKDLIKTDSYNILEFDFKYLLNPQTLGISVDTRNLAVYFNKIALSSQ
jgi:4-amino-4-deoxy-L-arabinose transferase-like glycosyltransferase